MLKSLIRKIFLAGLFFTALLMVLEISLRARDFFSQAASIENLSRVAMQSDLIYQPHPLWDHSLNSNVRQVIERGGGEFLYQTNSQGFRHSGEIVVPKPEGIFRVFILGDSFVEGPAPGPTVADVVFEVLRKRYPLKKFEVINAGVASQSLIPYIIRLRRQIFEMDPDMIVVSVDNSDVRDDLYLTPLTRFDESGIPWEVCQDSKKYEQFKEWLDSSESRALLSLGRFSKVFQAVWNIQFSFQEKRALAITRCGIEPVDHSERDILKDYSWIKNKVLTPEESEAFSEWKKWPKILAELCRRHGVPLVLTSYPHSDQWKAASGRHLQLFLRDFSTDEKIFFLDAGVALRKFSKKDIYLPGDVHFNTLGIRKWGELLGEFMAAKVIPTLPGVKEGSEPL